MGLQAVKWPFPCVLCSQLLSAHLSSASLYPMVLFSVAMTVWLGKKDSVVRFSVTKVISMPCLRKHFCVIQWPGPGWMKLLWPTPAKVKFTHTHKHNLRKHAIVTFCLHLKKKHPECTGLRTRVFFRSSASADCADIHSVAAVFDRGSAKLQCPAFSAASIFTVKHENSRTLQPTGILLAYIHPL